MGMWVHVSVHMWRSEVNSVFLYHFLTSFGDKVSH